MQFNGSPKPLEEKHTEEGSFLKDWTWFDLIKKVNSDVVTKTKLQTSPVVFWIFKLFIRWMIEGVYHDSSWVNHIEEFDCGSLDSAKCFPLILLYKI